MTTDRIPLPAFLRQPLARIPAPSRWWGIRHVRAWRAHQRILDAEYEWLCRDCTGWPEELDRTLPERIRKGEA